MGELSPNDEARKSIGGMISLDIKKLNFNI